MTPKKTPTMAIMRKVRDRMNAEIERDRLNYHHDAGLDAIRFAIIGALEGRDIFALPDKPKGAKR